MEDSPKVAASVRWVCERQAPAKVLSSDAVGEHLERMLSGGIKQWDIQIGGADGLGKDELIRCQADVYWSFGALTLPHELADVVATEQVYRAWNLVKGLPYHNAHR